MVTEENCLRAMSRVYTIVPEELLKLNVKASKLDPGLFMYSTDWLHKKGQISSSYAATY